MLKNILLIFVIVICVLAATGSILLGPVTQRLTADDAGLTVVLKTGEELLVTLEGNPSTGYIWEMVPSDGALLEQVGEIEFKTEGDLAGAPGKLTLCFQAVAVGEQNIRLIYHRPWEVDAESPETFEFIVIVE
jgi:inhibitor of cysteine peptidase